MSAYRSFTRPLDRAAPIALQVVRVVVGLLFIDHGLAKYQGKGGIAGFEGFLRSLSGVPFPALTAQVVPLLEIVGGGLLVVGLLTRVAALLLALEMVFTGFVVKLIDLNVGFVSSASAGVELDLLYLVALVAVLTYGPGRLSIDAASGLESAHSTRGEPQPVR